MTACLYLCATPIGNLKDITLRCLETLKSVDVIFAEDTRQTRKLLSYYQIHTPLQSLHAHNEQFRIDSILERLAQGQSIALVSDAGLPLISDPGAELVQAVQQAGYALTCLPGASAPVTALLLSGLKPLPFTFIGFLPRQNKARKEQIKQWQTRSETLILFEAPHRLLDTLKDLLSVLGNREVSVCRELTKLYEQVHRGALEQQIDYFTQQSPRGEMTLVIAGASELDLPVKAEIKFDDLKQEHSALIQQGLSKKEILQALQSRYGLSRNEIYARLNVTHE